MREADELAQLLGSELPSRSPLDTLLATRRRVDGILGLVVGDDGVLVQDFSGRVVYANDPGARLLGLADAQTLTRTPMRHLLAQLEMRDEDEADTLLTELPGSAVLRSGKAVERNLLLRVAGREVRYVTSKAAPMRDDHGEMAASVTVLRDITDRRRTAEFRERLLGIASHDLRSPLAAIALSAEAIARRAGVEDPRVALMAQQIKASSERATRMVHDLLDMAQVRLGGGMPLAPAEVGVGELVEASVREINAARPERAVVLRMRDPGQAIWDRDRVSQVLTNLINNALNHGRRDGPVEVSVQGDVGTVVLAVHNDGPAIPADQLEHLFEPFARGAGHRQSGVGLGLYIVREVVSAHGGDIDVHSEPAAGTTFTIRLPRSC